MTQELPTYLELMMPVLQVVDRLGGSATVRQIKEAVVETLEPSDDLLARTYPTRGGDESIYMDRIHWAYSYCKLAGVLERPKRGLYLVTELGREILALDTDKARTRLMQLESDVRRNRYMRERDRKSSNNVSEVLSDDSNEESLLSLSDDEYSEEWKQVLLKRLHNMSPKGFEQFVLYLLRAYGLELEHRGQSGDQGIDGFGIAPMSSVLSATVAVQAKRHDPSQNLGREVVALFQSDAAAAGAERAILVTLGGFTKAAREASLKRTLTVDLIDGNRLCDLALEQEVGVRNVPQVDLKWFDRFDDIDDTR